MILPSADVCSTFLPNVDTVSGIAPLTGDDLILAKGNRKRAHLASLESKLKDTTEAPCGDHSVLHEAERQFQLSEDLTLDIDLGSMDFQIPMPVENIGEIHGSQSVFPNHLSFVPSSQEQNPYMILNQPSSTPYAPFRMDGDPHQVQLESTGPELSPSEAYAQRGNAIDQELVPRHSPQRSSTISPGSPRCSQQVHHETSVAFSPHDFSDQAYLSVPGLSLIRAHGTIIERIQRHGYTIDLWDPFSISPFYQLEESPVTPPLDYSLTENYRPTPLQKLIKHHPIIDLLPWPTVRDKFLQVLSLPVGVRPQRAKNDMPNIVMTLIFDMKDAAGGLRVWGQDPFNEDNWEVGQRFFELWWWAFDSEIVTKSNSLRKDRGEDELRLQKIKN